MPSGSEAVAASGIDAGAANGAPLSIGLVSDTVGIVAQLLTARSTFNRPPVTTNPVSDGIGSTLFKIAAFRSCVFSPHAERMSIAAPDTCGVAIDVPLAPPYPPPGTVEPMLLPGAPRSTLIGP